MIRETRIIQQILRSGNGIPPGPPREWKWGEVGGFRPAGRGAAGAEGMISSYTRRAGMSPEKSMKIINSVEVNKGALIHAVVLIEGVTAGKPLSSNVVDIVSEECTFLPFMSVVARTGKGRKGSPFMTVLNEDTMIHNPHP